MNRAIALLCLLVASLPSFAVEYDRGQAVDISQAVVGQPLGDHRLRDVDGQVFDLSSLAGKPLVVSMIYTSCHHVCPLITRNLADTVDVAREALGEDAFSVVTVGFDWRVDTPERMRHYAEQQRVSDSNWYFLAGDDASIQALSSALGFQFYASAKGFDHLAQTTVVAANGNVYRQVYGVDIDTQGLVEPLKELVYDTPRDAGLVEHWLDNFRLFCTVYDPTSDRYRFDYSIIMTIFAGVLSLGALAIFIVREWRHAR